jgi:multiple sugar transport system ATP-binding protein
MRMEIGELHKKLDTTMIYVTHDQVEAMTMADKIVVLRAGNIEQVGSPLELYRAPRNTFVAGFIGSPKMNLLDGAVAAEHDATTIGIRPEHVDVSTSQGTWQGTVGVAEHLGSDTFIHIHGIPGCDPMTVRTGGEMSVSHGDTVYLTPQEQHIHRFDAGGLRIG